MSRYLQHRRWYETAAVLAIALLNGIANVRTNTISLAFAGIQVRPWEPIVWEYSSAIAVVVLIPAVVIFNRRVPITWSTLHRAIPAHFLASIVYCLLHTGGTWLLRKVAYDAYGEHFTLATLPTGIAYEYLRDGRTYGGFLLVIYCYRFVLLQLQGEARMFSKPEVGPPLEPVERPQRFLVRKLGKEFLVAAGEIEHAEAQGNYVNLHVRGRAYPLRSSFAALQAMLDPKKFVRVHRSHLINLEHLREIEPLDTGDARIKLRDGTVVPCSRTFRASLRENYGLRTDV